MNVNGMRVFVSGPMTGLPGLNLDAFDDAERLLRKAGAAMVYSPARLARLGARDWPHESCMLATLHALTASVMGGSGAPEPAYGVVALLDGWEESEGARAEVAAAMACGIPTLPIGEVTA